MIAYVVNLALVSTWEDFIEAFNKGFVRNVGGEWNGNFDAFNDYLYWPEQPFRLIVEGWNECFARAISGADWHVIPGRSTAFDMIMEIAGENPCALVEFK